jgi:hypothetical protein
MHKAKSAEDEPVADGRSAGREIRSTRRGRRGGRAGAAGYQLQDLYAALQLANLLFAYSYRIEEVGWEASVLDLGGRHGVTNVFVDDVFVRRFDGTWINVQVKDAAHRDWTMKMFCARVLPQMWEQWNATDVEDRKRMKLRLATTGRTSRIAAALDAILHARTSDELPARASKKAAQDVEELRQALGPSVIEEESREFLSVIELQMIDEIDLELQISARLEPLYRADAPRVASALVRLVRRSKPIASGPSRYFRHTLLDALERNGIDRDILTEGTSSTVLHAAVRAPVRPRDRVLANVVPSRVHLALTQVRQPEIEEFAGRAATFADVDEVVHFVESECLGPDPLSLILIDAMPVKSWAQSFGHDLAQGLTSRGKPSLFREIQPATRRLRRKQGTHAIEVLYLAGFSARGRLRQIIDYSGRGAPVPLVVIGHFGETDIWRILGRMPNLAILRGTSPRIRFGVPRLNVPKDLFGGTYPFAPFYDRPECMDSYALADQIAVKSIFGTIPKGSLLNESQKYRVTFKALEEFISSNLIRDETGDDPNDTITTVATAWAQALSQRAPNGEPADEALLSSGLFYKSTDTSATKPIADAVGSFLLGHYLASSRDGSFLTTLLGQARTSRRLGKGARRNPDAVCSWLALVIAGWRADPDTLRWLMDRIARVDFWLAVDVGELANGPIEGTKVSQIRDFSYSHGSPFSSMFPDAFDHPDHRFAHPNPNPISRPEYPLAQRLIDALADADVMSMIVMACSVADGEGEIRSAFLDRIVPPRLMERLKKMAPLLPLIRLPNGVWITERVLLLRDLEPTFPAIRRGHRMKERVARLPWLTAFIIARLLGGDLPTAKTLAVAYEDSEIARAAMDGKEAPNGAREAQQRSEWVWDPGRARTARFRDCVDIVRSSARVATVNRSGTRSVIVDPGDDRSLTLFGEDLGTDTRHLGATRVVFSRRR